MTTRICGDSHFTGIVRSQCLSPIHNEVVVVVDAGDGEDVVFAIPSDDAAKLPIGTLVSLTSHIECEVVAQL